MSQAPQDEGVSTSRLETLTDGVFAIVMTLLIFDLKVPSAAEVTTAQELNRALVALLPNLFALVVSFVVLGVYWVAHHTEFQYIQRADHALIWLNILFLLSVSLIPFSAGLLGRHADKGVAAALYGGNLVITVTAHLGMWLHATNHHRLVSADVPENVIRFGTLLSVFPLVAYLIAIGASFASPMASIVIYALVPVPYVLGLFYRFLR